MNSSTNLTYRGLDTNSKNNNLPQKHRSGLDGVIGSYLHNRGMSSLTSVASSNLRSIASANSSHSSTYKLPQY